MLSLFWYTGREREREREREIDTWEGKRTSTLATLSIHRTLLHEVESTYVHDGRVRWWVESIITLILDDLCPVLTRAFLLSLYYWAGLVVEQWADCLPRAAGDEIIHYNLPYLHMHPVVICNTVIIVPRWWRVNIWILPRYIYKSRALQDSETMIIQLVQWIPTLGNKNPICCANCQPPTAAVKLQSLSLCEL